MAGTKATAGRPVSSSKPGRSGWAWHPPLPLTGVPVFVWPPRPVAALRYLVSRAFLWSIVVPFGAVATITWFWLQPALERCTELKADWILQMYARNLGLMLLVAGGLHLFLFTFRRQGSDRKFDSRDLNATPQRFFARRQSADNMLWSLASGVTIWTAYEVGFMWAWANGMLPFWLDPAAHPVRFALGFVLIPFWASMHFYFIHRLLHWRPLYRIAHALHHRNDNLGPWSGLSMHPVEHVIYLSSVLVHAVLLSHPIHVPVFHMQWNTLGAAVTHAGFESLTVRGRPILALGSFHHQLHHRHYDCQLRQSVDAVGPVVRHRPRRQPRGDGEVRRRRREKLAGGAPDARPRPRAGVRSVVGIRCACESGPDIGRFLPGVTRLYPPLVVGSPVRRRIHRGDELRRSRADHSGGGPGVPVRVVPPSVSGEHHSPSGRGLPSRFQVSGDDFRPRARDVVQGVEHGPGKPRIAARTPAETNDRVVVPDRGPGLDDRRRGRALELFEQGRPGPGSPRSPSAIAAERRFAAERSRRPSRRRSTGTRALTASAKSVRAHRGVAMAENRGDERGRQGKPGRSGRPHRGRHHEAGNVFDSTIRVSAARASVPPSRASVSTTASCSGSGFSTPNPTKRPRAPRAPGPPPPGHGRQSPSRPPRHSTVSPPEQGEELVVREGLDRDRRRGRSDRLPELPGSTVPRSANRSGWLCAASPVGREGPVCGGAGPVLDGFITEHRRR